MTTTLGKVMVNPTAIDIESGMMCYKDPIPEVVCMSMADHTTQAVSLIGGIAESFNTCLEHPDQTIVGHNIAFDLSLLCFQYPYMWKTVFRAYDEGRIYDTLMRERLLMLTTQELVR